MHPQIKKKVLESFSLFWAINLLLAMSFGIIYMEIFILGGNVAESSPVEWVQEIMLFFTLLLFFGLAKKQAEYRSFATLVGSFFTCLLIRELDGVFDQITHGFWKYPAWAVAVIAIGYAIKHKQATLEKLVEYSKHPSFGLMLGGLCSLLVFSRLFGMGALWTEVMGDNYVRTVKDLVEEGVELMCYTLIFSSAVWYRLSFKPQVTSLKEAI